MYDTFENTHSGAEEPIRKSPCDEEPIRKSPCDDCIELECEHHGVVCPHYRTDMSGEKQ